MKPDAEYNLYFDRPYIDITESAKKDAIKKMEEAFKKK